MNSEKLQLFNSNNCQEEDEGGRLAQYEDKLDLSVER